MVKRKRILQIGILALVVMLIATPALAETSVANATFRGDVICYNSSGGTLSNTCSAVNINTQALIGGDFVTEDLLNTAVQTAGGNDIAYMPGVGTNPWIIYSGSIAPYEQKSYFFYTGGPDMQTGFPYFPGNSGMTTPDSASLELGNNFEIEQKGYIDTSNGTDTNLIFKAAAFRVYVSAVNNISAIIATPGAPTTVDLVPNAPGDYTSVSQVVGASTHWEAVDDPPGNHDGETTHIYTTSTSQKKDAFNIEDGSLTNTVINSVTVYYVVARQTTGTGFYAQPFLRLGSSETAGTEVYQTSSAYTIRNEVLERPGGGIWSPSDIPNLQVAIGLRSADTAWASCTQIYIKINYTPVTSGATVTATDVSSGVHTVKTVATGGGTDKLQIWVGDGDAAPTLRQEVDLDGASVPPNDNNWTFLQNDSMIYMDYHKISVGGTLKQHIIYERDTTFQDQTEYDNDAYPTFRTTSSPSISTKFENYGPISEAVATVTVTEDVPGPLEGVTPTMPPEMYGELNTEHLPGASLINQLLGVGGIPQALFWIPFVFGLAAIAVLLAYKFARSMVIIFCVGLCIVVFFALTGGGVVSFWAVIEYVIIGMALLVAEKHMAW